MVFADADLERVVPAVVKALIQNAGQSCSAGSRLLVQREIHDELVTRVAAAFAGLSIGPGIEDSDLGPVVAPQQLQRALSMIETARTDGARVVTGGGAPEAFPDRWYVEPTLITEVTPDMEIFTEEVFGPVLAVTAFDNEAAAVTLANDSPTAWWPGCGPPICPPPTGWPGRSGRDRCSSTPTVSRVGWRSRSAA